MTTTFLQTMEQRLLEEEKRLVRELLDIATEDPSQPGHFIPKYVESQGNSDDDNASEASEFADEVSLLGKLESELRDTRKAIQSLKSGSYGVCKYCKKQIDIKRLEARPTSSACIDCKKMLTQEL
jgi:RNA polymerase-binding transcription factor DksA